MIQNTSLQAYFQEVRPTLGDRQRKVLWALCERTELTNNELAQILNWPINTVTPRIFELRVKGLVEESSRRQDRVTGRTAIAWKIKSEHIQTKLF